MLQSQSSTIFCKFYVIGGVYFEFNKVYGFWIYRSIKCRLRSPMYETPWIVLLAQNSDNTVRNLRRIRWIILFLEITTMKQIWWTIIFREDGKWYEFCMPLGDPIQSLLLCLRPDPFCIPYFGKVSSTYFWFQRFFSWFWLSLCQSSLRKEKDIFSSIEIWRRKHDDQTTRIPKRHLLYQIDSSFQSRRELCWLNYTISNQMCYECTCYLE